MRKMLDEREGERAHPASVCVLLRILKLGSIFDCGKKFYVVHYPQGNFEKS